MMIMMGEWVNLNIKINVDKQKKKIKLLIGLLYMKTTEAEVAVTSPSTSSETFSSHYNIHQKHIVPTILPKANIFIV